MDDLLLLQYVRAVSKLANPARPQEARQRAFDASAKQHERFADVPSARVIARRLGKPWREVLTLAHSSSKTHPASLSGRRGTDDQHWLAGEHITYALKLVARRSQASTLSEAQYDAGREKLLTTQRSSRFRLPTAGQICTYTQQELYGTTTVGTSFTGTWARALELAELAPSRKPARRQPRTTSVSVEILDQCYDAHGVEPTPERLSAFAREQGGTLGVIRNQEVWGKVLATWHASRTKRRLAVPTEPPPPPTLAKQRFAALGFHQAAQYPTTKWADQEKCVLALMRYLSQIPKGKYATKKRYERWAREQAEPMPPPGALERHGGWDKLRVIAHRRMMKTTTRTASRRDGRATGAPS